MVDYDDLYRTLGRVEFNPSCSCKAVKIEGPAAGVLTGPPEVCSSGLGIDWRSSGTHFKVKS
jgi:hypothetical protein